MAASWRPRAAAVVAVSVPRPVRRGCGARASSRRTSLVGERGRLPGDGGVGMRGVAGARCRRRFRARSGPGSGPPGRRRGGRPATAAAATRTVPARAVSARTASQAATRVRGGGQRDGTALGAPGREAVPLRTVGAAGVVGARRGGGRGQAPAVVHREAVVRREAGCGGRGRGYALSDNGHYRTKHDTLRGFASKSLRIDRVGGADFASLRPRGIVASDVRHACRRPAARRRRRRPRDQGRGHRPRRSTTVWSTATT